MNNKNILLVVFISFITLIHLSSEAQKLPNVQNKSIYAPSNVKIDGKAQEINDTFEAYNHAAEIYYTLSNNDDYIYLTFQATLPDVVNRILNGGLSFLINNKGKKNDKDAIGITYPVTAANNKMLIYLKRIDLSAPTSQGTAADSLMLIYNKSIVTKMKTIKTTGIGEINQELSIYNDSGIKAAGLFDKKLSYTCEFAIPIKYLALGNTDQASFVYHIKINMTEQQGISIPNSDANDPLARMKGISVGPNAVIGQPQTDFWGEYTLAKRH